MVHLFLMLLNTQMSCVLLTVIIRRRASIMPSIMYKLLVSPPAHKGPKMVARPPTERLTPWLNPSQSQTFTGHSFHPQKTQHAWLSLQHHICWAAVCWTLCTARKAKWANLVFSLRWLWRRETPETRPRREAPAAAETLRWWRPSAPIHNHLAETEQ